MNRKKRIETIIEKDFRKCIITVLDNSHEHIGHHNFDGKQETHFRIMLKKNSDNKQSRIEIHRIINHLLKDEFSNGLHALEINIT
jgi:BolA protein